MLADTKAWYLSKTVWGGLLAIAAALANLIGVEIGGTEQAELADRITAFLAAGGGILAVAGRLTAQRRLR